MFSLKGIQFTQAALNVEILQQKVLSTGERFDPRQVEKNVIGVKGML